MLIGAGGLQNIIASRVAYPDRNRVQVQAFSSEVRLPWRQSIGGAATLFWEAGT
jgi:hypothetical protein